MGRERNVACVAVSVLCVLRHAKKGLVEYQPGQPFSTICEFYLLPTTVNLHPTIRRTCAKQSLFRQYWVSLAQ